MQMLRLFHHIRGAVYSHARVYNSRKGICASDVILGMLAVLFLAYTIVFAFSL